ncbi:hypothetical protein OWV82_008399 [Melia azedarach]|uniref:Uncharacterized protein n=1 Tax=Melia azedarach TaxID=155640 RepID=A0ACC1YDA6_MELAZ|nr:hypothetical protein OWV82_008399 [Melia azedarach]
MPPNDTWLFRNYFCCEKDLVDIEKKCDYYRGLMDRSLRNIEREQKKHGEYEVLYNEALAWKNQAQAKLEEARANLLPAENIQVKSVHELGSAIKFEVANNWDGIEASEASAATANEETGAANEAEEETGAANEVEEEIGANEE